MNDMTGTYDPADNKLRLRASSRLEPELYKRVRGAGFIWAPKQDLFVAPMWTPYREDLLLELCGEIGDEDTSLVERAEQRADRFADYSANRAEDAEQAHQAVSAIADNIPLGQPILVGHHSEKRARKDAERIENGMRKTIKLWDQSQYWKERAKGALRHAQYKERPDVRARRIKGIEADKRKQERNKASAERSLRFWNGKFTLRNTTTGEVRELAITEENRNEIHFVLGRDPDFGHLNVIPKEGGQSWEGWDAYNVLEPDETRYKACPRGTVAQCQEAALKHYPKLIEHYSRWIAHYDNRLDYERAMMGDEPKQTGPEKGGACRCWASPRGGWSYIQKVNKVSVTVLDNWGNESDKDGSRNFTRTIPFDKLGGIMSAAEVQAARESGMLRESSDKIGFFYDNVCSDGTACPDPVCQSLRVSEDLPIQEMRDALEQGVKIVSTDQLFPTPTDLANRVADLADLVAGDKVLEPSAGTGQLVKACLSHGIFKADITAIEINRNLADLLGLHAGKVIAGDFLERNGDLGTFNKILMNPPFSRGADIAHIKHALTFLNPGGRLVAICANGPKQREQLEPIASQWIDLEPGAFAESGTNVNAAIVVIESTETAQID